MKIKDCITKECIKKDYCDINGFCMFRYERDKRGTPLNKELNETMRGKGNPRWNGGTSQYPNHSLMKKIRKEVLTEANNICQYCGKFTNEVHHKDLSKDNHIKENLVACCHKCNSKFQKVYNSKYRRRYGLTLQEMVNKYGKPMSRYYFLESQGKLKEFLSSVGGLSI